MPQEFPSVTNNQEKYETYKTQMERFTQARNQGFYLEGIFILYAMLEDRLSSFLFYAGVVNKNRDGLTKNKAFKPHLDEMLESLGNGKYRLQSIGKKISILKQLMVASLAQHVYEMPLGYREVLYAHINQTKGHEEVFSLLEKILLWCQARNELVHALLNKNVDQQEDKLIALIEEGFCYCRKLDNFVSAFKRGNTIRKQFNIQ